MQFFLQVIATCCVLYLGGALAIQAIGLDGSGNWHRRDLIIAGVLTGIALLCIWV